jgi:hypothetical protein
MSETKTPYDRRNSRFKFLGEGYGDEAIMGRKGLFFAFALCAGASSLAHAQNTSVTTVPPQKNTTINSTASTAHQTHKPKTARAVKQQPPASAEQKTATPTTIPMDFSGMARRPVDLKPESTPSPRPDTGQPLAPSLGASPNGGFSPGMKIGF